MVKKTDFNNKVALIVGASGAIGSAITKKLGRAGASLFILGSNAHRLDLLVEELETENIKAEKIICNLASLSAVEEFIDEQSENIKADILINAAGIYSISAIGEYSTSEYIKVMNVNLNSPYILSAAFSPYMVDKGWGRIVNIGSSSAYTGFPNSTAYCVSKHGLLGLSRALHQELKCFGVRVYCVSPSSTQGNMGLNTPGQDYSTFLDPEEVAEYVLFAISFDGNAVSEEIFIKRMIVR
jgi:fengycin family lipopeptide synthetase B